MIRYSIVQTDLDSCYFCNRPRENIHEVFFGSNRQKSIKNGFCVGLCARCHRFLHDEKEYPIDYTMDLHLKKIYQREYEKKHTREEFIKLIGKSYLD